MTVTSMYQFITDIVMINMHIYSYTVSVRMVLIYNKYVWRRANIQAGRGDKNIFAYGTIQLRSFSLSNSTIINQHHTQG